MSYKQLRRVTRHPRYWNDVATWLNMRQQDVPENFDRRQPRDYQPAYSAAWKLKRKARYNVREITRVGQRYLNDFVVVSSSKKEIGLLRMKWQVKLGTDTLLLKRRFARHHSAQRSAHCFARVTGLRILFAFVRKSYWKGYMCCCGKIIGAPGPSTWFPVYFRQL